LEIQHFSKNKGHRSDEIYHIDTIPFIIKVMVRTFDAGGMAEYMGWIGLKVVGKWLAQ
jgi:hypothetical protein